MPPVPFWAGGVSILPFAGEWDPSIECQLQIRNRSEHANEGDLRAPSAGDGLRVKIIRDPRTGPCRKFADLVKARTLRGDLVI